MNNIMTKRNGARVSVATIALTLGMFTAAASAEASEGDDGDYTVIYWTIHEDSTPNEEGGFDGGPQQFHSMGSWTTPDAALMCGDWYQVDRYLTDTDARQDRLDAIVADGMLDEGEDSNEGQDETVQLFPSDDGSHWKFVYGGDCEEEVSANVSVTAPTYTAPTCDEPGELTYEDTAEYSWSMADGMLVATANEGYVLTGQTEFGPYETDQLYGEQCDEAALDSGDDSNGSGDGDTIGDGEQASGEFAAGGGDALAMTGVTAGPLGLIALALTLAGMGVVVAGRRLAL